MVVFIKEEMEVTRGLLERGLFEYFVDLLVLRCDLLGIGRGYCVSFGLVGAGGGTSVV